MSHNLPCPKWPMQGGVNPYKQEWQVFTYQDGSVLRVFCKVSPEEAARSGGPAEVRAWVHLWLKDLGTGRFARLDWYYQSKKIFQIFGDKVYTRDEATEVLENPLPTVIVQPPPHERHAIDDILEYQQALMNGGIVPGLDAIPQGLPPPHFGF